MPEAHYRWLPNHEILSFEELAQVVNVFTTLGVRCIRLTGGEPLLRHDLPTLIRLLSATAPLDDLALTTNGVLLAPLARDLKEAGLHRLTVSLDTLKPEVFRLLAQRNSIGNVLEGIEAARRVGFSKLKIDTVIVRGMNDSEIFELIRFARSIDAEIRFIEYMDVGGATQWSPQKVLRRDELLALLTEHLGPLRMLHRGTHDTAERFMLENGQIFGIISSTSVPFCRGCDRSRITADGHWFHCLYARKGHDLKPWLREGRSFAQFQMFLVEQWQQRSERGAEARLGMQAARAPLATVDELRGNPHLEMHTRGG